MFWRHFLSPSLHLPTSFLAGQPSFHFFSLVPPNSLWSLQKLTAHASGADLPASLIAFNESRRKWQSPINELGIYIKNAEN